MRAIRATVGPLATADADGIAQSQTPVSAFTLNGALVNSAGVAVLDMPRRVLITAAANESGKTFTITGTDWNGNPVSETLTGPNTTTAQSVYDYKTVTAVTVSSGPTGAVTIGTNGVASTRPIRLDTWAAAQVALQVAVSGTVNATVQQSLDDPNVTGYTGMNWVDHPDSNLVALTATKQGNYGYAPLFVRLLLNSGTGTAVLTVAQSLSPLK